MKVHAPGQNLGLCFLPLEPAAEVSEQWGWGDVDHE